MRGRVPGFAIVILLTAASCGGAGDGGTSTSQSVFTSEDGQARLVVPAGAMPSGTEITINPQTPPDTPDGVTALAFSLEPSGLEFSEPALLTVTLPYSGAPALVSGMVVLDDGSGQGEGLVTEVTRSRDEVTVEAEVSHFSTALVFVFGVVDLEVDCPEEMFLGDSCSIDLPRPEQATSADIAIIFDAGPAFEIRDESDAGARFECVNEQELGLGQAVSGFYEPVAIQDLLVLSFYVASLPPELRSTYRHDSSCEAADSIVPELTPLVVTIGSNIYTVTLPSGVAAGSQVDAEVCRTDSAGEPVPGGSVYVTTSPGEPGDPAAIHGNAPAGDDGCGDIGIFIPQNAFLGMWGVWTYDEESDTVEKAGDIEVGPDRGGANGAPESLGGLIDSIGLPAHGFQVLNDVVTVEPDSLSSYAALDSRGDHIDSISTQSPAYTGLEVDIVQMVAHATQVTQEWVDMVFNQSILECFQSRPPVVCTPGVLPVPAGGLLVVMAQHAAPVPPAASERSYIYSLVFDSDRDPGNDWRPSPPFDWDYFGGTDRWYEAKYDHGSGTWVLFVTQRSADGSAEVVLPSAARVVVVSDWIVWFVPASELPGYPSPLRASAFAHDGAFGAATRGGDVTGADPTEPLVVPPAFP